MHCISFCSFEYFIASTFTLLLLLLFCQLERSVRAVGNKILCERILFLRRDCLPIQEVDESILFSFHSWVLGKLMRVFVRLFGGR